MSRGVLIWVAGGVLGLAVLTATGAFTHRPSPAPQNSPETVAGDPAPIDPVPATAPDICPADSDLCADPDAVACDSPDGVCDT